MTKTLKSRLIPLTLAGLLTTTVACAHNYGNTQRDYPTDEQTQTEQYPEKTEQQNTSIYGHIGKILVDVAFTFFRLAR